MIHSVRLMAVNKTQAFNQSKNFNQVSFSQLKNRDLKEYSAILASGDVYANRVKEDVKKDNINAGTYQNIEKAEFHYIQAYSKVDEDNQILAINALKKIGSIITIFIEKNEKYKPLESLKKMGDDLIDKGDYDKGIEAYDKAFKQIKILSM